MGGGKWSTYRKMAEDLVDKLIQIGNLEVREKCSTKFYVYPGAADYSESLYQEIEKTYKIDTIFAKRLQNYYGTEVFEVLGKNRNYWEKEFRISKRKFCLRLTKNLR